MPQVEPTPKELAETRARLEQMAPVSYEIIELADAHQRELLFPEDHPVHDLAHMVKNMFINACLLTTAIEELHNNPSKAEAHRQLLRTVGRLMPEMDVLTLQIAAETIRIC